MRLAVCPPNALQELHQLDERQLAGGRIRSHDVEHIFEQKAQEEQFGHDLKNAVGVVRAPECGFIGSVTRAASLPPITALLRKGLTWRPGNQHIALGLIVPGARAAMLMAPTIPLGVLLQS